MTDKEFIQQNPDAKFIGFIKVGNCGCGMYFTDRAQYEAKLDRVWDSGHDFESRIIKE
jgi:hypothetical protein